jgi:hypothetical protein
MLDPTFNGQLPNVAILPLLEAPFLFGSLVNSLDKHHALFEILIYWSWVKAKNRLPGLILLSQAILGGCISVLFLFF